MRSRLHSLNRQHDVMFRCCQHCVPVWHVFPLRDSTICLCHKHRGIWLPVVSIDAVVWTLTSKLSWILQSKAARLLRALCAGMINVTNHLLTPTGQNFGLWLINLLHPAVFSQPLFSVGRPLPSFPQPHNTAHLNAMQSIHALYAI